MNFFRYVEQYLQLIPSFPFVIQVALYFIFFNTVAVLIFMGAAIFVRRKKRLISELEIKFSPKYRAFFNEIFTSKSTYTAENVYELYVEEFGERKLNRKMYAPLISTLEDMVKDNQYLLVNKNYRAVIKGLKVEDFLIRKLDFSNTRNKLRTFHTLAALDLTVPDSSILPFTHSKNPFIRKESRSSYVAISNNDPFKFFDQSDNSLNYWDGIALIQQLELHHRNNLPNFSRWIKYSKNNSQLLFIIKAVGHFNQTSSAPALVELLETDDHDVRRETIIALGQMRVLESESIMMNIYSDQPKECQHAIAEALLSINSGKALPFLISIYEDASSYESKKLIAEVIYKYSYEGKLHIQELQKSEIGFNKLILEHIKNPLIPSLLNVTEARSDDDTSYISNSHNINISTQS